MAQFVCQKCRTPLRIDGTLQDLNPASFNILANAAPILEARAPDVPRSAAARERRQQYDHVSQQASSPIHKRHAASSQRDKVKPDMSYIMLSGSQIVRPEDSEKTGASIAKIKTATAKKASDNLQGGNHITAEGLKQANSLFETLSARSDIDHPVCSECTELLLDGLHERQASTTRERDAYVQFLKQAQEDIPTDEEKAKTSRDLEEAHRREKQALEELEALEAEKARMEDEIAALDAEADELDEEEEKFWRERNAFTAELTAYQEERDSLQNQLAHDNKVLEALQRTNVYNDTFCIGHDGLFGTINGLRLGRLADHPVDWAEINAAWGQTMLLLAVVAEKLRFTFRGYRLHPIGSTSRIEKIDADINGSTAGKPKGTVFELFTSGDVPLSFGLLHRSSDSGMVAFLDCLRQLGEHVEKTPQGKDNAGLKMPYNIAKDKIGDVSIKLGNFGQDEQWTKACKYTLTCCKFLLAHASHVDDLPEGRNPE